MDVEIPLQGYQQPPQPLILTDDVGRGLFKLHHIRVSYEQFKAEAQNYPNIYKKDGPLNTSPEQVARLRQVFCFQARTLTGMQKELSQWLKNYPQFYNDDADVVVARMRQKLLEYQGQQLQRYPGLRKVCPYVNWIPNYGGLWQARPPTQAQFYAANDVPYDAPEPEASE